LECVDHQWQRAAGCGIDFFNELYVGRIAWNRVRMVKTPDTGRRISRPNTRDQWQTIEAPHLRIVDETMAPRFIEAVSPFNTGEASGSGAEKL
jgi:hypothetical protein